MKNLTNFVLWPAIAGFVFAISLLAIPAAVIYFPSLARFLPAQPVNTEATVVNAISYSDAIKQAAPAVISINSQQVVERTVESFDDNNPFNRILRRILDKSNSLGSGVIISADGYIITSYHIFSSPGITTYSEDSMVTLNDGRTMEARRLVMDEENDLALLKVDAENLPYINIGSASSLDVGDVVLAIGNPRNIGQSVSLGIISALLRKDDSFVIQTDAAINPGNSGGALIDVEGNLIGINSSIVSESGGSEGIGFATPAGEAISLMENYIESGPSGYLGVDSEPIRLRAFGIVMEGFRVLRVAENSPADKAGILVNDIITSINQTKVDFNNGALEFINQLSSHSPGDTVNIEIFRNSRFLTIPTTLGVGEPMIYRVFDEEAFQNPPIIN